MFWIVLGESWDLLFPPGSVGPESMVINGGSYNPYKQGEKKTGKLIYKAIYRGPITPFIKPKQQIWKLDRCLVQDPDGFFLGKYMDS